MTRKILLMGENIVNNTKISIVLCAFENESNFVSNE